MFTSPRHLRALWLGALIAACAGCASAPPPEPLMPATPVASADIDLARFMGTWHVIAHIPYFAERGHVTGRYEYRAHEGEDKIAVRYLHREGFNEPEQVREARASVKSGSGGREWTLWFAGVVPAKFRILEVAPDYSWALIDYPDRDLGWIFARSPRMDDAQYQQLIRKMRDYGINARQLVREPQLPDQVGQTGFAEPKKP